VIAIDFLLKKEEQPMKYSLRVGLVIFAMGIAPAFAQQPTYSKPNKPDSKQTTPPASKPVNPPATKATTPHASMPAAGTDERWVKNVSVDNLAEVELGQLAATKASSDQVKSFAQHMVDDHGKANDELKSIVASKNITLPAEPDAKHKAVHDRLSKLSGAAFDRAYMREMVAGHRMAVNAFRTESKTGKDADIKAWASKTLPTIEEHLKMAQETTGRPVGTSGTKRPRPRK
jgi:putative membrane protein